MFKDDETRFVKYVGIALLAAAALWVGAYIVRSAQNQADIRAARKLPGEPLGDLGAAAATVSKALMQPVHDATMKSLDEIQQDYERREAERKAQIAAEREARRPKAYRWKDKDGVWHLSDAAPQDGSAVEVIAVQIR